MILFFISIKFYNGIYIVYPGTNDTCYVLELIAPLVAESRTKIWKDCIEVWKQVREACQKYRKKFNIQDITVQK